jgi:hypothetical protein
VAIGNMDLGGAMEVDLRDLLGFAMVVKRNIHIADSGMEFIRLENHIAIKLITLLLASEFILT